MPVTQKRYSYVFWDWNGTIIDDLYTNFNVINSLLNSREKPAISLSEYRSAFTFPIKEFYERIGLPIIGEKYDQLVYDYWDLYKSKIRDIHLMVGILDVLSTLKKNQVKQYILSASDRKMVFEQMSMYQIQSFFEDVIAPQDGYALGKVELTKQWISTQNIYVNDVIMIGDTFHDWETANAINIDCALVDRGHQDLRLLEHESNIMVFNNVSELANVIFNF